NSSSSTLTPSNSSRATYWLYHELWRLVTSILNPTRFIQRLEIIFHGKEAVFDWDDPLPFFLLHHFQIPMLLLKDLRLRRGFVRIDFNIGKLVQLGGD
ncbi:MAG: ATP-grasp enzyme, partial [Planctomycetota bacterium]|nr:ATP-grasp enzyme [Planctomycetota bacterium]